MRQEQRHLRTTSNVGWLTIDEGSQQASRACDAGARVRNLSWTQTDAGHGPHAFHSSVMMRGLATRFVCFFVGRSACVQVDGRWRFRKEAQRALLLLNRLDQPKQKEASIYAITRGKQLGIVGSVRFDSQRI
jgi:hypothetical protein